MPKRAPPRLASTSRRAGVVTVTVTVVRKLRKAQRERVILAHRPLVEQIARKLLSRLPGQVELDELESAGTVGLVEAAATFDAARGVPFGAFARRRIQGAIIDHLRAVDPLSRVQRAKVRTGRHHHFEVQLHADDLEHAREHGLATLIDQALGPDVVAADNLAAARLRQHVEALPPREREVVVKFYWLHHSRRDIARDMGCTRAWVSCLKKQACQRLRRAMSH